jgi:hypothetical protein
VVADSHHFDVEQDAGTDPKFRINLKSRIQFRIQVNNWIWICIQVMRIRNPAYQTMFTY